MSGRKVELDEVTVPAPLLESSTSQKTVSATPTPISEEANDNDHETSEQDTTKPHRSTRVRSAPEWYGNPVLEVVLLDHDEPMNYGLARNPSFRFLKFGVATLMSKGFSLISSNLNRRSASL